jgi:hypothetical protein
MWLASLSNDVIKDKLKPFISAFVDRAISQKPYNNDGSNYPNNNTIVVPDTIEPAKNSENTAISIVISYNQLDHEKL